MSGRSSEESIAVGSIRIAESGSGIVVEVNGEAGSGKVTLDVDTAAVLYDMLGTFAVRALRYADAVEERRTRPPTEWQYLAPDQMEARSSGEGFVSGPLKITQVGSEVRFEVANGTEVIRAVLDGYAAYRLHEPILEMCVRAGSVARA